MTNVLDEVVALLAEVVGEDFVAAAEVGPDTTFTEDLALESIEFVALAERLRERFGDQVDFPAFLAGMDLGEILGMTVGDLVTRIESRLPDLVG